jgi:phytanoyl-CoA hydroxylase
LQENGCLWAVPGSHKSGVKRRFKRLDPPAVGTEFIPAEDVHLSTEGAIPVETPAGSLVLIHHSVVHYSAENTSDAPRHAYTIHIVDGKEGVDYPADNWLQRMDGKPFNTITEYV